MWIFNGNLHTKCLCFYSQDFAIAQNLGMSYSSLSVSLLILCINHTAIRFDTKWNKQIDRRKLWTWFTFEEASIDTDILILVTANFSIFVVAQLVNWNDDKLNLDIFFLLLISEMQNARANVYCENNALHLTNKKIEQIQIVSQIQLLRAQWKVDRQAL